MEKLKKLLCRFRGHRWYHDRAYEGVAAFVFQCTRCGDEKRIVCPALMEVTADE